MTETLQSENATLSSFSLYAGQLAFGTEPNEERLRNLKAQGVSHIAAFLTDEENATHWRQFTRDTGLEWLWMPVHQTLSASDIQRTHLHQYLTELSQLLKEGAYVYFYCDDSMHRCALMFYALCHACRIPSSSAYPILHSMPALNANTLTRESLHWAARLGASTPV
ncbi:hypothetical protein [Alteromonas sp. H39]|uniref:hypothetical protein n=1 Tax=Alteromonas sp. H39 TaxID=3389876 RepID=UPI0039E1609F